MYYSDKQLRLILFVPLLVKMVIETDIAYTQDNITEKDQEQIKEDINYLKTSVNSADELLKKMQKDLFIDNHKYFKLIRAVKKTIDKFYNLHIDLHKKEYKVAQIVSTAVFSYWEFCDEIANSIGEELFEIHNKDYLFYQPFIDEAHNLLHSLRIAINNTIELKEYEMAKNKKVFNKDKFFTKIEALTTIGKKFIKEI